MKYSISIRDFKKGQAVENRIKIINAFRKIGKPASSYDISKYLEQMALEESTSEVESLLLSETQRQISLERRKKHKTMALRTIQNLLPVLSNEGVLNRHEHNRYSLSENAKYDIRYHPDLFGLSALDAIMGIHYPTLFPYIFSILLIIVEVLRKYFKINIHYCSAAWKMPE